MEVIMCNQREISLEDFSVIKLYFFGNDEQKKKLLLDFIIPFSRENLQGDYYISKDWNGGPNIQIIFSNNPHLFINIL